MNPMSKTIETIYRNGRIDSRLMFICRRTRALPSSYPTMRRTECPWIPRIVSDPASDIGPPDLARNLEHYLYGHPKQS